MTRAGRQLGQRARGWPGRVFAPGEWGSIVNGGAWLTVRGAKMDLIYRDLDEVLRWTAAAEDGRRDRGACLANLCQAVPATGQGACRAGSLRGPADRVVTALATLSLVSASLTSSA